MSFVKHAIFVGEDAPKLEAFDALTRHILDRLNSDKILITRGIVDHLDHASPEQFVGGKLGVDATGDVVKSGVEKPIDDVQLLEKMQAIESDILELKQYYTDTKTPICVITLNKSKSMQSDMEKFYAFWAHIKLLVIVDKTNNDINNPYMLLWRVANNIDARRDISLKPFIIIDATNKGTVDGYDREWPGDTLCTKEVLDSLQERGLIDIDESFIRKFGLLEFE